MTAAVDVGLVVVRLVVGCWLLWSLPRLRRAGVPSARHSVSVVVPARDEADQLPRLLGSLSGDLEVIVVDDGSTDATDVVAADGGATVVAAGPVPPGWTGKAWACAQGARHAHGSTVVFVDADVWFAADGLDRVVATLEHAGGLVSVQPYHEPGSATERLAALFNVVALAATDAGSPLGRRRGPTGAFGPVLATRRDDYEAVGTHEAVRGAVVDDAALADRYRASGRPVTIRAGGDAVAFRMYPGGLGQLVEGFTKNLAAGVRVARPATVALVVLWSTLLVQAALAPVSVALVGGSAAAWAGAAALFTGVAGQFWWMARRVGRFGPLTAALFPVHLVVFLAVFARSSWATARGTVSWRGRRVATRRRPDRADRPGGR